MATSNSVCRVPSTPAEQMASCQADAFTRLLTPKTYSAVGPYGTCPGGLGIDMYMSSLDQEFLLDAPVVARLTPQLAALDADAAALMLGAAAGVSEAPQTSAAADQELDRLLKSMQESTVGGGNILGNTTSTVEAALRAAWRRQAAAGFRELASGNVGAIRLSPHITLYAKRIGKGGELRKGAALYAKTKGLPIKVVQGLDGMFTTKSAGLGNLRVSPLDVRRMEQASLAVAGARVQSNTLLRVAGKGGGAMLAFGPSAAIDFYQAYTTNDGAPTVAKDFAIRSAKSQSGNLLGVGAGLVAVAAVGAVGAPAVVIALGVGIVVQSAWGYFGGDDAAAEQVKGWFD